MDFLNTSIHLAEHGKLFSKVYIKPTDTFPLFVRLFKSNYPVETKLSIISSQARRYRLITTYDEDIMKSLSRLKCIHWPGDIPISHGQFQVLRSIHTIPKGTPVYTRQQGINVLNLHLLPFVFPYHRSNKGSRKFLTEIGTS